MAHVITTPFLGAADAASVSTSGISNGQMMILAIRSPETNNAVADYGFTHLGTATTNQGAARADEVKFYYKVASSEPANYDFEIGGGNSISFSGELMAFSARSTSAPNIVLTNHATTAGKSPVTMTLTGATAAANDDIAAIFGLAGNNTTGTWALTSVPGSYTNRGGQSDAGAFTGGFIGSATRDNVSSGATGNLSGVCTRTGGTGQGEGMGAVIRLAAGAAVPSVTSVDGDNAVFAGQTGVVVAGTTFGASQGVGSVVISPTDDIDDAGAVTQTVTAWSDTSVTITVVKGSLSLDTNVYLFVENNAGDSNAAGRVIQIQSRPYVRETLIGLGGAARASVTDITMLVYHTIPATAVAPAQRLVVATNGSGEIDQVINRGSLAVNDPVWIILMKDGSPASATARKVTPVYE